MEVLRVLDLETLRSLSILAFIIAVFELSALTIFILSRKEFGQETTFSIVSVLFCAGTCASAYFVSEHMRKQKNIRHWKVTAFKVFYFILLSAWAIVVTYHHYSRGDYLLTFYTVTLIMVCFIPLRPSISVLLMGGVYLCLYLVLQSINGVRGVNKLNFCILAVVSVAAMLVRYHSQLRMSEKTVQLQRTNDLLEYSARHDALTGLRNRKALEEDVEKIVRHPVTAFMIDINYFKEINDTHGHTAGDEVLKETAKIIRELFPGTRCYRYGGDEFLVIRTEGKVYEQDTYQFSVPAASVNDIVLSIGRADGEPVDHDQLFNLIRMADKSLYTVKERTHSPEFGGHDRRRRI